MTYHPRTPTVAPVPLLAGILLFTGACALLMEDALHGHWHLNHLLQPMLMAGTIVAGTMAHHRLARLRPSGLAFAALAILGSSAVVYATLSRTATARDAQQADALAQGRQLSNVSDELVTARADAKKECASGFGAKCSAAKARVDALVGQMSGLKAVSVDPRGDALVRLAELVGWDGQRTRAIVAALDPVILPLFLEAGCILFFAAAFPHRRVLQAPQVSKTPESFVQTSSMSQRELARKWGVHESTVSRRLRKLEAAGEVARNRAGKSKQVLALTDGRAR